MKTALIFASHRLSAFAHPNALRLVNIALILRELGYDARLYGADPDLEAQGELKGFHCEDWKLGRGRAARKNRFRNWKARIDAVLAQSPEPDLIISAVSETQSFRVGSYLANYARRKRIPFAVSLVEWFSLKHFSGPGKHDYLRTSKYKNCVLHEFYMRFVAPRRKNIIAISSYLEKYYRAKGCETIVLPTLVDMDEYSEYAKTERAPRDRVKIVYAGSPRRKDCILNAVEAIRNPKIRGRVELHFFGADETELRNIGLSDGVKAELGETLVLHGRLPYGQIKREVADADFTVLLRENKRNANAGFSTKVGESMACGTPVIANITSDLAQCLTDGETGFVCRDESPQSCLDAIARAAEYVERSNASAMRSACVKKANEYFDYRVYVEPMRDFLDRIAVRGDS